MKRSLKFILLFAAAAILTSICVIAPVRADDTMKATNVKVEITVNDNNTYDITETIDIYFSTPHHGIMRNIPLENYIFRADGSTGHNHARVSKHECNQPYSVNRSDGQFIFKIGDPDKYVEGAVRYVISYRYDIGNDTLKGADELYLNIIGTEWTYEIENLEVIIHMPKQFDFSKFGVSHGYSGTVDYSNVYQKMENNTIYVQYSETLRPYEAFTVRCELPEGYFRKKIDWLNILAYILCPLASIAALVVNRKNYITYGKPDIVVETVEFYPPEDMSPPRLVRAADNYASDRSINGLLLTLASKGYLKIEDIDRKNYRFILLNNRIADLSEEEQVYLEGLWSRAKQQPDGTMVVEKEDLRNSFYLTIREISNYLFNDEQVYEKNQHKYAGASIGYGLVMLIAMPFFITSTNTFRTMMWYHFAAIGVCGVLGLYLFILGFRFKRRTQRNNELYGRIKGFQDFLRTAEKDRLEMLVEDNPSYFYDILPYAYALNITDVWIKKFEDIMIEPADWYSGRDFNHFVSDDMNSFESDSTSSPSSDGGSSSSSSGGGSSGGGSGGGGSSGW